MTGDGIGEENILEIDAHMPVGTDDDIGTGAAADGDITARVLEVLIAPIVRHGFVDLLVSPLE